LLSDCAVPDRSHHRASARDGLASARFLPSADVSHHRRRVALRSGGFVSRTHRGSEAVQNTAAKKLMAIQVCLSWVCFAIFDFFRSTIRLGFARAPAATSRRNCGIDRTGRSRMRGLTMEFHRLAPTSSHCPLPTAHCPLPTAHCSLLTAHGPLPTAHGPLPTAHCSLPTAHGPLPTLFQRWSFIAWPVAAGHQIA
jgi:hypothetical protein